MDHGARQPCQVTSVGTGGGAPLALLVCVGIKDSFAAVCRAVLVCLLAGNMDTALMMSAWAQLCTRTGEGRALSAPM